MFRDSPSLSAVYISCLLIRLIFCVWYSITTWKKIQLAIRSGRGSSSERLQGRQQFHSTQVSGRKPKSKVPISVNYHFTRKCNYTCGFCFHTAKSSNILSLSDAKRGLRLLSDAGMRKLNFAGGEPFLYPKFLGPLVEFCKLELRLESVSIVTNGSKVTKQWLHQYGKHLDIMAVSCDSFDESTNVKIGRGTGKHVGNLKSIGEWCREEGVMFKMNTVVNRYNWEENMADKILDANPFRWKVFQVLVVPGENDGPQAIRNAEKFVVSDQEFQSFCENHKRVGAMVVEGNDVMRGSYLILDEEMRFLDHGRGSPGKSILEVGVEKGLKDIRWDEEGFAKRGGIYDWSRKGGEHTVDERMQW